mgnify:FL=1
MDLNTPLGRPGMDICRAPYLRTPPPQSSRNGKFKDVRCTQSERPIRMTGKNRSSFESLPPAAPVFQSNIESSRIFFGTPTSAERRATLDLNKNGFCEQDTPSIDHNTDSPGLARVSSPLGELYDRRNFMRHVLGDVSNVSPTTNLNVLKTSSPPVQKARSTPLRASTNLSSIPVRTNLTPVQSALKDWATTRFERSISKPSSPVKAEPRSSPGRISKCSSIAFSSSENDIFSSPTYKGSVHACKPSNVTPFYLDQNKSPARSRLSSDKRYNERHLVTSPHPPPRRVPGFVPASISPAKRVKVNPPTVSLGTASTDHMRSSESKLYNGSGVPEKPHETTKPELKTSQQNSRSSPNRLTRLVRPVKYVNHAPAARVWDSPEKRHSGSRTSCAETAKPPNAENVEVVAQTSVPIHQVPKGKILRSTSRQTMAGTTTKVENTWAASNTQNPSQIEHLSSSQRPRRVLKPVRPSLSSMELARLTSRHTKQNEFHTVQIETRPLRIPGQRPASPSQRFVTGCGKRAREQFRPNIPATNEYGEPMSHALGAGDDGVYSTPPGKNVRWDKRLIVSPTFEKDAANKKPIASCLTPTPFVLDAFGNVACQPMKRMPKRSVVVQQFIYDDDDDDESNVNV